MYKKYQSTKSKFIVDGVFRAEVNELLQTALAEYGFSGIEVNFTKRSTEVRVLVSKFEFNKIIEFFAKFKELMNQKSVKSGFKINELRLLIEQRFGFNKGSEHKFTLTAKQTNHFGVCAQEQAEYLKSKLLLGIPVRSAAMNVIRNMLNKGAKGCEVIISGKLRQQRAKSMKFKDGYLIHTGEPKRIFIDSAVRHIELRQGIMGVKVKIMLPYNARAGENRGFGIPHPLPDVITFRENKKNE